MQKKGKKLLSIIVLVLIMALGFFIAKIGGLESDKPEIMMSETIYSNAKEPISIFISDEKSGLKSVKITLRKEGNESIVLYEDNKIGSKKELQLELNLPKMSYKEKNKSFFIEVVASDASFWGFASNEAKSESLVIIDDKAPKINILSNSYQIEQGGAASVVFGVSDENLDEVFIQTDKGQIFKATPYLKPGYYAALIAWDSKESDFRAFVVAKDKAANVSQERIRYYLTNRKYKNSNIKLSDKFLDGKIVDLSQQYAPNYDELDRFAKFKFVNETLRLGNEDLIHKIASEVPEDLIEDFKINLFLPLRNGAKVADFADHRFYYYNDTFVSESYHLGLDFASTAKADIVSNNDAKVVLAEENGIYGLNLLLYHGFGLYTLYGHNSSVNVAKGDEIKAGDVIAKTGTSGLALGDHLHFGILVQGVEVRPEQWQDRKWIENNIYKVLNEAKKQILGSAK